MWLNLMSAPAEMPVTLAEAKAHLRYRASDQDALIGGLIGAAVAHLEGRTGVLGRSLVTQTWEYRLPSFPIRNAGRIEIPMPPLQSVQSVKYIDTGDAEVTLSAGDYVVDAQHLVGRIRPAPGKCWPVVRADDETAVRIVFLAGYGTASAVPYPIKQAILLLVGHWFMTREAVGQAGGPVALAVEALTTPFRVFPS